MNRDQFGELVCGYWDLRGEAKAFLSDACQPEVDFLHSWYIFGQRFCPNLRANCFYKGEET